LEWCTSLKIATTEEIGSTLVTAEFLSMGGIKYNIQIFKEKKRM
jgi:hypothetical protein